MVKRLTLSAALLWFSGTALAQDRAADAGDYPDREFAAALYVWGTEIKGTIDTGSGSSADIDASFPDILRNTNVAVFAAATGRIGRFVGILDGMWVELEGDKDTGTVQQGPITLGPAKVDANVRQGMGDLKLGYRILEPASHARQPVSVDLLAGGRYWFMRNEVDLKIAGLPQRNFIEQTDWVDPIVGVRVIVGLTPRVQFSGIADVGGCGWGSSSDRTYQVMGLLGVKLSDAWSLRLGYKQIAFERGPADVRLRGPVLGTVYTF